ncbi:MAG TPA: hypothetical protein VJT67_07055 [Longimicrobiaceae bacterium]|nr:hypothetical protein [Longimicrobiaceae bacterium]
MKKTLAAAALGLVLTLAGCQSATDSTPELRADGTWSAGSTLTLTLKQSGHDVTGTGSLFGVSAGVSGTSTGGKLALTLRSAGYSEVHLSGTFVSTSTLNAELNDSGFDHYPVTLYRK